MLYILLSCVGYLSQMFKPREIRTFTQGNSAFQLPYPLIPLGTSPWHHIWNMIFCSVLHTASYPTGSISDAQIVFVSYFFFWLLISSWLILLFWFLSFYHWWVGYVVKWILLCSFWKVKPDLESAQGFKNWMNFPCRSCVWLPTWLNRVKNRLGTYSTLSRAERHYADVLGGIQL